MSICYHRFSIGGLPRGPGKARPEREVVVLVGDGSYLMLNSAIATSVGAAFEGYRRKLGER